MFTSNDNSSISPILLNRLKKIYLKDYDDVDKFKIVKEYSLPRIKKTIIGSESMTLSDDVIKYLIKSNKQPGVRDVEKHLEQLCLMYSLDQKQVDVEYVRKKMKLEREINTVPFGMYI